MSLFMSMCLQVYEPHANAMCQGPCPDGSEDRAVSDQALPGFFSRSRAPHCPTEGEMWSGKTKPRQSEVEGLSGNSLSDH